MKTRLFPFASSLPLATLLLPFLVSGCLQERLAWSPDGRHAAVITADGLHLATPAGDLSPLVAPGAYRVAWLNDSARLVLARTRPVKTFAEVAAALGPERTRALVQKAGTAGRRIKELPWTKENEKLITEDLGEDLFGVLVWLREQPEYLAALREKLGTEWKREEEESPVDLHEVMMARWSGGTLQTGPVLHVGLTRIRSLRPSPGGQVVAFATTVELSPHPDQGVRILVAPVAGSAPATVVATQTAAHPDWSPDGRSLVMLKASGGTGANDELRLGALVERRILDANGTIAPADELTELAGLLFHQQNRVRCLRDGRILFNASPVTLPTTGGKGGDREQLFVISRSEPPDLRPVLPRSQLEQLPRGLSMFEVSPDESQLLVTDDNAGAFLVTLASGTVAQVAAAIERDESRGEGQNYPAATWRAAGEFTFLRRSASGTGTRATAPFELVLRRDSTDAVLSRTWDPALLNRLIQ